MMMNLMMMVQQHLLLEASNMPYVVYGILSVQHTKLYVLNQSFCSFLARRKEEMDAEAAGDVGFNRVRFISNIYYNIWYFKRLNAFECQDPIVPDSKAGTKENPILVIF